MFNPFKKIFGSTSGEPEHKTQDASAVSEWASSQGFSCSASPPASPVQFILEGKVCGRPWKMEIGKPLRDFVHGTEIRVRADLQALTGMTVVVMNRALKGQLEKKAYHLYTDSLQTTADPNLPEEMRWLAVFQEFGWDNLPRPFWDAYAVLSDDRARAVEWVQPVLAQTLMLGAELGLDMSVPQILVLQRGKVYWRAQYQAGQRAQLDHAIRVLKLGSELALMLKPDIAD